MTYFQFLAVFLGVPIFALLVALRRIDRASLLVLTVTAVVAVLYTTPWDNLIVLNGVWSWPADRIVGLTIGVVPIEEYTFFVLQTFAAGLLTIWLARRQ